MKEKLLIYLPFLHEAFTLEALAPEVKFLDAGFLPPEEVLAKTFRPGTFVLNPQSARVCRAEMQALGAEKKDGKSIEGGAGLASLKGGEGHVFSSPSLAFNENAALEDFVAQSRNAPEKNSAKSVVSSEQRKRILEQAQKLLILAFELEENVLDMQEALQNASVVSELLKDSLSEARLQEEMEPEIECKARAETSKSFQPGHKNDSSFNELLNELAGNEDDPFVGMLPKWKATLVPAILFLNDNALFYTSKSELNRLEAELKGLEAETGQAGQNGQTGRDGPLVFTKLEGEGLQACLGESNLGEPGLGAAAGEFEVYSVPFEVIKQAFAPSLLDGALAAGIDLPEVLRFVLKK